MVTDIQFRQAAQREGYSDEVINQVLCSENLTDFSFTESGAVDIPEKVWLKVLNQVTGQPVSRWMF